MTENEAIQALKLEGGIEITGNGKRVADFITGLDIAIGALKEIKQYREIGTVEECRDAVEKHVDRKIIMVILDAREIIIALYAGRRFTGEFGRDGK